MRTNSVDDFSILGNLESSGSIQDLKSTGLDGSGLPINPGLNDTSFIDQGTLNPVITMNPNPAWLANGGNSQWVGVTADGTANVAGGQYTFRTSFDLTGKDHNSAEIDLRLAADNVIDDVLLNGVSTGISYTGFNVLSSLFNINTGFAAGVNTLDFLFYKSRFRSFRITSRSYEQD